MTGWRIRSKPPLPRQEPPPPPPLKDPSAAQAASGIAGAWLNSQTVEENSPPVRVKKAKDTERQNSADCEYVSVGKDRGQTPKGLGG
jgi:hypothetical protein